jgi:hypothetical protein
VILGGRGSRRAQNRLSAPARQEPRPPKIVQLWLPRPVSPRITHGYLDVAPVAEGRVLPCSPASNRAPRGALSRRVRLARPVPIVSAGVQMAAF